MPFHARPMSFSASALPSSSRSSATAIRPLTPAASADPASFRFSPVHSGSFAATMDCRRAILHCSDDCCRRNHSPSRQRRFESEAERCCGRDRHHSDGFYLGLCRLRGDLSLPASATTFRRRAILLCSNDGAASILKSGLEIKNRCTQKVVFGENRASILKSEPEIKNRCTQDGING